MQMSSDKPKSRAEQQINENLRLVYEEAAKEEIPDRFKDLLNQLKDQESKK